jgi:cathepsin L
VEILAATKLDEGNNDSALKALYEKNALVIPEAQKEFSAKRLVWNPNYLIDWTRIDWKKILMGAQGCTFNTSYLTPVKDQRSCGSCWAFAAAATWEHSYKKQISATTTRDVSEEDLVNCAMNCAGVDPGSCSGGWSDKALDYITCYRVANETAYPYTATDAACRGIAKSFGAYGWVQIGTNAVPPSNDMVKAAITTYGAVTTYVYVKNWGTYGTGVLNAYPNDDPAIGSWINHAITIVGWCDDRRAWIIKNSWGTSWGSYGGYAYVAYDHYNINERVYAVCPRP